MAVDVIMPQMGESIAEGTVIRWMKKVGDQVERDEPLFEISTDKVDAEIPSPAAGTLTEILAEEGQTVAVNAVVARLATDGAAAAEAPKTEAPKTEAPKSEAPRAETSKAETPEQPKAAAKEEPKAAAPQPETAERPEPAKEPSPAGAPEEKVASLEDRRRTRSSPVVRKIAQENDVDISRLEGSGVSGRVTKKDILQFLDSPREEGPASAPPAAPAGPRQHMPAFSAGESVKIEPMSMMRKKIADHMVLSRRTSAHVSTVFEVDFTAVDRLRRAHKDEYLQRGVKLTFMPFIVHAVVSTLREFPVVNASIDGDNVVYKRDINVGIAVALEWGLIVPVLKRADEMNILGMSRALGDLAERARTKKLSPDEVQGGTFTITNPGGYGGLFGLPIINQPQVAILGVGGIKKRPVVIETAEGDAIVIRSMAYLSLTFDHRLIDGAVADQFMARIKSVIEGAQFAL
jgi:pyruvate dehydrogenase E2 component (dihydrolipoamide acetyltransferase)